MILSKEILDSLYRKYNTRDFVLNDPIQYLYEYNNKQDQEIVGFIASSLAFGHRTQIIPFIKKVLFHLGKSPYESLLQFKIFDINSLESLVYRYIQGVDLQGIQDYLYQIS